VLGEADGAGKLIEQALGAGANVSVTFVYRPFDGAVDGALMRLLETGRPVEVAKLGSAHINAQKAIFDLHHRFGKRGDVIFTVAANDGTAPVPELKSFDYLSGERRFPAGTKPQSLDAIYQERLTQRLAEGRISGSQYTAAMSSGNFAGVLRLLQDARTSPAGAKGSSRESATNPGKKAAP
jgi:hypothetical protein